MASRGRPSKGRTVPNNLTEFKSRPVEEWGAFEWNPRRDQAAHRIAEAIMTKKQIADEAGVSVLTLYRWIWHPDFSGKIKEYQELFYKAAADSGMAKREARVHALRERLARMTQIIEARQAEYSDRVKYPDAPKEVETGMIVRTEKTAGRTTIVEWTFDKSLAQELRETEKQLAQEVGEWTEKREVGGPGGAALTLELVDQIIGSGSEDDQS